MDNRVDTSTGTITAWSVVDNPKNQLIPGGFATAMLSNKNAPVMVSRSSSLSRPVSTAIMAVMP